MAVAWHAVDSPDREGRQGVDVQYDDSGAIVRVGGELRATFTADLAGEEGVDGRRALAEMVAELFGRSEDS